MASTKYEQEHTMVMRALELAIEAIRAFPPKQLDEKGLELMNSYYTGLRQSIGNPEKKYQTLASLKISKADLLIFFQESSGECVEYFWRRMKEEGLPVKRENKIQKILRRGKIRNAIEYHFVIDVLVPYRQEGMINDEDEVALNRLIGDFEMRNRKKSG